MTVQVSQSAVVDASIEQVWSVLRDFNSHGDWHPAVSRSQIDGLNPADKVSAVRSFELQDGAQLREQLLHLSDIDYSYSYCLLDAPIPLHDYVSEVTLKPITDRDQTLWIWSSSFETPPGQEQALKQLVEEQIYQAGFASLQQRLNRKVPAAPSASTATESELASSDLAELPAAVRVFSFADAAKSEAPAALEPAPLQAESPGVQAYAIVVDEYGDVGQLQYRQIQVPPPQANEVRIRHEAIGVNYIDVYCRTGYYRFLQPPGVLGMEAAGLVTDLGAAVSDFQVGDRVVYAAPPVGAYSEFRNIDAQSLVLIPASMSLPQAAAIFLKGITAEFLLHRVYPLKSGDTILVHAAAGGVGLLLCQWASALGARVIGTVSSDEKAGLAAANGCQHPIVYSRDDFVASTQEITRGQGVDAVFDAVGKSTFAGSMQLLGDCGHMVSYGQADQPLGDWDIESMTARSLTLSRPNFGSFTNTRDKILSSSENLFAACSSGILKAHIGQQFALADAAEAHRALQERRTTGSTILIPPLFE